MGRRTSKNWEAFSGRCRQLIVAIDIGTTFSGAAYSILQPGEVPKIYDIGSFPGQQAGFHKVPSTVLYSPDGTVLAVGSETTTERIKAAASHIGAHEARWWKMALRRVEQQNSIQEDVDDYMYVPPGKSAQDIFVDYLRWIMKCTESFISTKYRGGSQLIEETRSTRTIVLTHPNGWEGAQQAAMRKACVESGIVTQDRTKSIRFVSEAEASLNFALTSQSMSSWTQEGSQIVIVDAGGGTIDITSYKILSTDPYVSVCETSIPRCLVAGAVNVDRGAAELIAERLDGTRWDNPEDLAHISDDFTKIVKHSFNNQKNPCVIKIGPVIENDDKIGIRKGMLVIEWDDVVALFKPSIDQTVTALREIFSEINDRSLKRVALVGGFSENAYFRETIASALARDALVAKPDNSTSKAVANGAVAWAIDSVVSARVSKLWYGICCAVPYDKRNPDHSSREESMIHSADGHRRLPNAFHPLLAKGDAQAPDKEAIADFSITKNVGERLEGCFDLLAYRGSGVPPPFIEDDNGFETICRLEVNLDRLQTGLRIHSMGGKRYRRVRFQIHAFLSDTELKARWVWNEQAVSHSGEVHTVFLDELDHFTRKVAKTFVPKTVPKDEPVPVPVPSSPSIASLDLQTEVEAYRAEESPPATVVELPAPTTTTSSIPEVTLAPGPAPTPLSQYPVTQEQIEQFTRAFFAMQTEERQRSSVQVQARMQPLAPSDLLGQAAQRNVPPLQYSTSIGPVYNAAQSILTSMTNDRGESGVDTHHQACSEAKRSTSSSLDERVYTDVEHAENKTSERQLDGKENDANNDYSPPPAYTFLDADIER